MSDDYARSERRGEDDDEGEDGVKEEEEEEESSPRQLPLFTPTFFSLLFLFS